MAEYVETFRGMVQASECDQLGHMNVQFYIARVSDATWHLMLAMGLGPKVQREQRVGLAAVRQEIDYRHELRAGDLIVIESAVRRIGTKSVTLQHRIRNAETGEDAAVVQLVSAYFNLATRESHPLPDEIRERAAKLLVTEEA